MYRKSYNMLFEGNSFDYEKSLLSKYNVVDYKEGNQLISILKVGE